MKRNAYHVRLHPTVWMARPYTAWVKDSKIGREARPQLQQRCHTPRAHVLEQHPFQSGGAAAPRDFSAPAIFAEAPPRLAAPAPAARLDTRMTG